MLYYLFLKDEQAAFGEGMPVRQYNDNDYVSVIQLHRIIQFDWFLACSQNVFEYIIYEKTSFSCVCDGSALVQFEYLHIFAVSR